METATGCIEIQFVPANEFGVLDHVVKLADGQSIRNSMRVVPNGDGSEVMFTLLQLPEMNERQFVKDVAMVETDLLTLKDVLEGGESVD